ncbi:ankyrin, partial [Cadophora sp. DSE1049]
HAGVVEVLLDRGANPNAYDGVGRPPLLLAAANGELEIVKLLIRKGANINIRTKEDGYGALQIATSAGNSEILAFLADSGADLDLRDNEGAFPLIQAAASAKESCARILLDRRAPILSSTKSKNTAYLESARTGTPELVKLFAERGANTKGTIGQGSTALHIAIELKNDKVIDAIIDTDAALIELADDVSWTPLHRAASGNPFATKRLIARGAVLDSRMSTGATPLAIACRDNRLEEVELLIKAGASLDSSDNFGWGPIHYATSKSNSDVLRMLVLHGANINLQAKTGFSAFHMAAEYGFVDMMSLLLEIGGDAIDIDGKTKDGHTTIHIAATHGKSDVISFLVARGANVN